MSLYELMVAPFADYAFMRRALVAACCLSVSGAPLGVFLMLRRMALVGDTMSHAILPGIAAAYLLKGFALLPMMLGGLLAGIASIGIAAGISRRTRLKEDASFTVLYLTSLAGGVMLITLQHSAVDLLHLLFGNVLAVDPTALWLMFGGMAITVLLLAAFYRGLVIDAFDPLFLRAVGTRSGIYPLLFFVLVVLNLVVAFQALGTLMALGLMLLPAIAARFWSRTVDRQILVALAIALASSYTGLLLSYHFDLPSGPSIVLAASACAFFSILTGSEGGTVWSHI